ncbi:RNA polymerase sigma factor [Limnoglobus roseus]|uniref:RNA polymerase subunit sigma-24 n=1 Tax=Limnoglobus roseus TaxID=2598579 RepID=A0A5C1A9K9_9BACT|nr:sigma factor [Limnoglobus roseus]QEL15235.1 RNA polymerase subunit sigma-24 [Limnoglobus roseus]
MAELCAAYWYPLYAYLRRHGREPADAEDAVQGFFAWLLESNAVRYADPGRGRFRCFLVTALNQYLARRREYESAEKRTPPGPLVSIDAAAGEDWFSNEPADDRTPDMAFEYTWAVSVVRHALDRLRAEQAAAGKEGQFDAYQGLLTGQGETTAVAAKFGMNEGAVRVAVHRLRKRYAEVLQEEVAATLEEGDDVNAELQHLIATLELGRRL